MKTKPSSKKLSDKKINKTKTLAESIIGSTIYGNEPADPTNQVGRIEHKQEVDSKPYFGEYGATGVQFFAGMIRNEEYFTELKGLDGIKIYDRMRRSDAQVRGTLMALMLPIRQCEWWVEPASDSPEDVAMAQVIEDNLFQGMQTSWDDFLRQALTHFIFGHSLFEIVYKYEDGLVLIDKLAPRMQKSIWRWFNDKNGNLQIIRQYVQYPDGSFKYIDLPYDKCLLFVHDQEGNNYEGISVLRSAYKHWFMKDELYKIDALGHDRFSSGIPYMRMPVGYHASDADTATVALENLHSRDKSYVLVPPGWEFDIKEKPGSNDSLIQSIAHHNGEIAKNILAQFINLGSSNQSGGSRSLSDSFEQMFMLSLNSGANYVCDIMNRRLIKKICDMNWKVTKYPILKHSRIMLDIEKFMQAIASIGGNQMITKDYETENHIRDILGFPTLADNRGVTVGIDGMDTSTSAIDTVKPDVPSQVGLPSASPATQSIPVPTAQPSIAGRSDQEPSQSTGYANQADTREIPQYTPLNYKMSGAKHRSRKLTELESRLISVDFIEKTLDEHVDRWHSNVIKVRKDQIKKIAHDVLTMPASEVKASYIGKLQDRILQECLKAYSNGKKQVHNEIQSQKKNIKTVKTLAETIYKSGDNWTGKDVRLTLQRQAELDAAMMSNKLINTALYKANDFLGNDELSLDEKEAAIVKHLEKTGVKEIANVANKSISMAYGIGREVAAVELSDDIQYAVYSCLLDENACDDCLPKDQVAHALDDPEFQSPNPGCFGGANRCRCMNIYVLDGLAGPFETRSKQDYEMNKAAFNNGDITYKDLRDDLGMSEED